MTSSENLVSGWVSWAGDETDPIFRARWDPSVRWNGWLCPYLERPEIQKLIDYNNLALAEGAEVDAFEWDGHVLLQITHPSQRYEGDPFIDRLEPIGIDGILHWTPGAFGWTWCETYPPLTQDEAEAIDFDGRIDGRGVATEGNLFPEERRKLVAYRRGDWCLHCGSPVCELDLKHNAAYGGAS